MKELSGVAGIILFFIIGLLLGGTLGFLIAYTLVEKSSTVVFERDNEGRITALHYVRAGK